MPVSLSYNVYDSIMAQRVPSCPTTRLLVFGAPPPAPALYPSPSCSGVFRPLWRGKLAVPCASDDAPFLMKGYVVVGINGHEVPKLEQPATPASC